MTGSFNLSDWAIHHRSLVAFFMIIIVVAGIGSYMRLGRSEDPAFTVKTMVVQVAWPGATIDDTLKQVTDPVEKKLQETPYLDYLRSYTIAGQTTIYVNLLGVAPPSEVPDVWYQVRKKVNDIRATLPSGIQGPFFNDEFGDTYGIIYAFTADGFTHRELRDRVEDVRTRLLRVADVSKIEIFGTQDEKIYLEFSVRQLALLGLDRQLMVKTLQEQNAITPAGIVQTQDEKIMVRVSGVFRSEDDIRKVNFVSNGRTIRLSDIATVTRGYSDPPQPMFRINGVEAIGLAISMRSGGDVLALGDNVAKTMRQITADLPIGIEPRLVADQPEVVHEAVDEFTKSLWEAVAIVLAVSLLSLGLRAGAVVAASIPLVLAAVFMLMEVLHIDLQRISLGALIIALGLLVDDAMITVEAMVTKLEEGWDKARAATYAYTSTAFPMLTGTLVTVAGFVPIGFARSSAGEYTFSLFAVVGIALVVSWIVAVVFAPLIGVTILPATVKHKSTGELGPVMKIFRRLLVAAMRMRWPTIAITVAIFALSMYGIRYVPQQFFPSADRPELLIDFSLTENASIYATAEQTKKLDDLLRNDPDVEHWSTYVGSGAIRFYLPLNVQLANDFIGQFVIVNKSLEARDRVQKRLEAALPQEFPGMIVRVYPLEMGPPVGWPLQYRISGPDPDRVRDLSFKVAQVMGENAKIRMINYNWIGPSRTLRMRVDQDQARLLGVSSETLAQVLDSVVTGVTITSMLDDIYSIDVVARAISEERISPETLRTIQIPVPGGRTVPLMQFATVEYTQELPLIWRRDREPTLTVQADVIGGVQPATAVAELAPRLEALNKTFPVGYQVVLGGSEEESKKSQASVAVVVPVMALLMCILLMIQLQSFQRLFLVLSVAPLGMIGVVAALLVSDKPLGFVALLGVIALTGMIIRNSVILVDRIEVEIAEGRNQWDAVIDATIHRFRPILLTAAAAILGMIPIAPTVFWGPMAYAIMGGLAVATALTLVFLPALYVAWFRVKEPRPA